MAVSLASTRLEQASGAQFHQLFGDPRLQNLQEVVHRRKAEQEAVEAIEHAAVTLDDRAEVLDVEVALEHALGQVADRRHDGDDEAEQQQVNEQLASQSLAIRLLGHFTTALEPSS